MTRSRFLTTVAATALGLGLLGACGADSITEFGLERVIAAQVGEDIDVNFGDDGLNLSGKDGEISFNFDDNDRGFTFEHEEGSGQVVFDDDGDIRFDTTEGSGTVNIDDQGFVINTDDGERATFAVADDGGATTITTGDVVIVSSQHAPENWPDWIGVPATLNPTESSFTVSTGEGEQAFTAALAHGTDEAFAAEVAGRLEAAGFSSVNSGTVTDEHGPTGFGQWQRGEAFVNMTWEPGFTMVIAALG